MNVTLQCRDPSGLTEFSKEKKSRPLYILQSLSLSIFQKRAILAKHKHMHQKLFKLKNFSKNYNSYNNSNAVKIVYLQFKLKQYILGFVM